jgi:hypothetical protein
MELQVGSYCDTLLNPLEDVRKAGGTGATPFDPLLKRGWVKCHRNIEALRFWSVIQPSLFTRFRAGCPSVAIGFLVAGPVARLFRPPRGLWRLGVDPLPRARCRVAPPPTRDRRAHTSLRPKPSKGPPAFYHRSLKFATYRYCKVELPRQKLILALVSAGTAGNMSR